MSQFSLKAVFPLLVVLLVFLTGGVFFASTGLMEPFPMGETAQSSISADSLAPDTGRGGLSDYAAVSVPSEQAEAVAAGDALFKGNCAQCHAINEVVVGPALGGIEKRRPEKWLLSWIKNSSKLVAADDEYAVKVFNQYQQQQMPSFQLSDTEIRQILAYIKVCEGATSLNGPDMAAVVVD